MRELPDLLEAVERDREIAAIRERLARLESDKAELEGSLNKLLAAREAKDSSPPDRADRVTRMRHQELLFGASVLGAAIALNNYRRPRNMRLGPWSCDGGTYWRVENARPGGHAGGHLSFGRRSKR
jgi:hypothetical protein